MNINLEFEDESPSYKEISPRTNYGDMYYEQTTIQMKLIKIKKDNYVIVDSIEIKDVRPYKGRLYLEKGYTINQFPDYLTDLSECKLITHSTQPLEYKYGSQKEGFNMGIMSSDIELVYDKIKPLSLSDIEEAIFGYNLEKMSDQFAIQGSWQCPDSYEAGFNAAMELTKDKLFTIEDIKEAFYKGSAFSSSPLSSMNREQYLRTLVPKTEWDVEISEDGKLGIL